MILQHIAKSGKWRSVWKRQNIWRCQAERAPHVTASSCSSSSSCLDHKIRWSVAWRWREAPPANKSRSLAGAIQTVTESREAGATRAPFKSFKSECNLHEFTDLSVCGESRAPRGTKTLPVPSSRARACALSPIRTVSLPFKRISYNCAPKSFVSKSDFFSSQLCAPVSADRCEFILSAISALQNDEFHSVDRCFAALFLSFTNCHRVFWLWFSSTYNDTK